MLTHRAALEHVQGVLRAKKLDFKTCDRADLSPKLISDQLIITIGGDGTLLETSHYVEDNILLGVNSNPNISVGSLCVADTANFKSVLEAYLSGALKPISVSRIQIELDNRVLPILALNDILIAHKNPAAMTRYQIEVGMAEAIHKNSGLWVSTACGSTGAMASTGGKVQKIEDHRLQWVCREPYFAKNPIPDLLTGFLAETQKIKITSYTTEGAIFIDGPHLEENFGEGQQLVLSVSDRKLNCLITPELETRRQQIGLMRENYEFERR